MMKIGIITWFNSSNYGTNLQAIALQFYLRQQGYTVEIINCEVKSKYNYNRRTFWQRVVFQPEKYAHKYAMKKFRREVELRDKKLRKAIFNNCIMTTKVIAEDKLIEICNQFDLLICGSDQIWNPNWYHRFYFADYEEIKTRRISYAPSMGVNKILDEVKPEIMRSVSKFDAISVREEIAAELLTPYVSKKPTVVVDPTFLLCAEEWNEIFPYKEDFCEKPYVLGVFLEGTLSHMKAARNFAKKKNISYVVVPYSGMSYLQKGKVYADAGVEDLLNLIRGAQYVVTDSFHITVFSIILKRQFSTFLRFKENPGISTNSRIYNLLRMFDLENRILPYKCKEIKEQDDIEYSHHEKLLQEEIQQSKYFLINAVEGKIENGKM